MNSIKWEGDNNVTLVLDNNTQIGITVEDIKSFKEITLTTKKFMHVEGYSINLSKVSLVVYK